MPQKCMQGYARDSIYALSGIAYSPIWLCFMQLCIMVAFFLLPNVLHPKKSCIMTFVHHEAMHYEIVDCTHLTILFLSTSLISSNFSHGPGHLVKAASISINTLQNLKIAVKLNAYQGKITKICLRTELDNKSISGMNQLDEAIISAIEIG